MEGLEKEEMDREEVPGILHITGADKAKARTGFQTAYGESMMTCPYNKTHVTSNKKCLMHFTNCRKAYLARLKSPADSKVHICKYDGSHHVAAEDYEQHLLECSRRNIVQDLREAEATGEGVSVPALGPNMKVRIRGNKTAELRPIASGSAKQLPGPSHGNNTPAAMSDTQLELDIIEGAQRNICHFLEPSPPMDILALEPIDFYADFDVAYPIVRHYTGSPPFFTTSEEEITTTDVDTSGFLSEEDADWGDTSRGGTERSDKTETETGDSEIF